MNLISHRESIGWLFYALCRLGWHGTRRLNFGYSRGCDGCARLAWGARRGSA